ncbi:MULTISPECIES: substrate-binding domain-containing protein [Pseudomonas]|uniref:substrate-binding domain-containing protein n=1 Tax=Pseudomonas TaxID=286 RepID=UPI0009ED157D|nr:substrate-binding domain-containing protein [Pseudomonas oryzihabitans]
MNGSAPVFRRAFLRRAVLATLLPLLPSPLLAGEPTTVILRLQGSNTINANLGPRLVAALLAERGYRDPQVIPATVMDEWQLVARAPNGSAVAIQIAAHGSSTGFNALAAGTTDLAAASRPIKDNEVSALANLGDMGSKDAEYVIGLDGLAIIVHPANPLRELDLQQLAQVFAGDVTDWQQLGGPSGPIRIYARDDRSGTYDTFRELVLNPAGKRLSAAAKRFESNEELAQQVAADPGGIGFTSLAAAAKAPKLALRDGEGRAIAPSEASIATEDYPLARRLFLYGSPAQRSDWARSLLEFSQTPAGQAVVQQSGFVAQRIEPLTISDTRGMPPAYLELARRAQRLTVNFRFTAGSARLDNKALRDVERLAAFMRQPENAQRQLILVGFNDATEDPARAALLARLRATAVATALRHQQAFAGELLSLGDQLPVAGLSANGRVKNRRVEAWIQ